MFLARVKAPEIFLAAFSLNTLLGAKLLNFPVKYYVKTEQNNKQTNAWFNYKLLRRIKH